ncbi:MAG TPA: hypothetical protein VM864_02795 [Pyrinomonadaceae bacterium]|nr:hypothetical protein [Pyrinomonadaceae bacterium]
MKKRLTGLTLIAALVSGAAIASSAQRRKATTAARKQSAAQTTPAAPVEPPPAKKNVRRDDAAASRPNVSAETPAPAERSAEARPAAGQATSPAGAAAKGVEKGVAADDVSYTYQFAQPEFDVRRVVIEHDAAGHGRITFERKNEEQPLTEPLDISPTAFARIVSAWEGLKFLDSAESYQTDKQFPHLGTYRLRMRRGVRERATEFNWTNNDQASALIREYRRLTEQQLFVFDIGVARQYQPTESVKVLRRLEILLDRDDISDKSTLAPLLGDLVNDERIPLIARNHAARLLKRIAK